MHHRRGHEPPNFGASMGFKMKPKHALGYDEEDMLYRIVAPVDDPMENETGALTGEVM